MNKRAFLLLLPLFLTALAFADPSDGPPRLIPEPRELHIMQGHFRVRPSTPILVEFGHQEEDRIAADTLAEEILDRSGLQLAVTAVNAQSKPQERAIVLARLQDQKVRKFLESKGLKADSIGDQGYLLFCDDAHIIVAANTGEGLFHGVQTLRQLLRMEGKNLICPSVAIRDWPTGA